MSSFWQYLHSTDRTSVDVDEATSKFTKDTGQSPLHVAAAIGDVESVKVLLDFAAHVLFETDKDNRRNALHVAAMEGHIEIVRLLLEAESESNIHSLCTAVDKNGYTPLHCAIVNGNLDCIKALGRPHSESVAAGDVVNNAPLGPREVLDKLYRRLFQLQSRGLVVPPERTSSSFNRLHLAALSDNPAVLRTVLETFYKPQKRNVELDEPSPQSTSALLICAEKGDHVGVNLLLQYGASLDVCNASGQNVAHILARKSAEDSHKMVATWNVIARFLYRDAEKNAGIDDEEKRACYNRARSKLFSLARLLREGGERRSDNAVDSDESTGNHSVGLTMPKIERQSAVRRSVRKDGDVTEKGMTAVQLAASVGSVEMLQSIISTTSVLSCTIQSRGGRSDCCCVHQSRDDREPKMASKYSLYDMRGLVPSPEWSHAAGGSNSDESCLAMIGALRPTVYAMNALEIEPMKRYLSYFSVLRRLFYIILFCFHIVHMCAYSLFVIPTCINSITSNSSLTATFDPTTHSNYWFLLLWPGLMLFMQIIEFIKLGLKLFFVSRARLATDDSGDNDVTDIRRLPETATVGWSCGAAVSRAWKTSTFYKILIEPLQSVISDIHETWIFDAVVSDVGRVGFCALMAVWYWLFTDPLSFTERLETYAIVTSIVLIYGWSLSLEYLRGLAILYPFVVTLKMTFYRDVLRVMAVFCFFWFAFATAMHIFRVLETRDGDLSLYTVVYEMFGAVLGQGPLFDATLSWYPGLQVSTGASFSLVYGIYLLLTSILLLNLLIAKMSHTHEEITRISKQMWNVECLNFAIWLTKDWITRPFYCWFARKFVFYDVKVKKAPDRSEVGNDDGDTEERWWAIGADSDATSIPYSDSDPSPVSANPSEWIRLSRDVDLLNQKLNRIEAALNRISQPQ